MNIFYSIVVSLVFAAGIIRCTQAFNDYYHHRIIAINIDTGEQTEVVVEE